MVLIRKNKLREINKIKISINFKLRAIFFFYVADPVLPKATAAPSGIVPTPHVSRFHCLLGYCPFTVFMLFCFIIDKNEKQITKVTIECVNNH